MESLTHQIVLWFSGDGCTVKEQWTMDQFEHFINIRQPRPEMMHSFQKLMLVKVQPPLRVVALVCFILPLDAQGCVRDTWRLPLDQILSMGEPMMLTGYGPVSVAALGCSSVNWYAHSLWRPMFEPGTAGTFAALKNAVNENPLGLPVYQEVGQAFESLVGDSDALLGQMIAPTNLDSMVPQEIDDLWRGKFESSQQKMIDLVKSLTFKYQELLKNEREENQNLVEEIDRLMVGPEHMRNRRQADRLTVNTLDTKEKPAKWARWFNRKRADDSHGANEGMSMTQIAQGLARAGIELIATHPGIGKTAIPPEHLQLYLENPTTYVVSQSGMSAHTYQNWRDHINNPTCRGMDGGKPCGKVIEKCEFPKNFVVGITDCCERHRLKDADSEDHLSSVS